MDEKEIIEAARSIWSAGGVYIGPSEVNLIRFARIIEAKTLERVALAFEAEVETWHELKRVGYAGSVKRQGSAAIRALGERK